MDVATLALRIESLEAKVGAANLADLAKSGGAAAQVARQLQSEFEKLAAILGPAALAAGFIANIKHAIELQDQYVRLSEIAGTTASKMSAFDLPSRLAGTSLDAVATSIARLSKSIGDARLGDVASGGMLKALGIDIRDGRDASDVFADISKVLIGMKDQTIASAISMQLLGRGFAEMRPLMKEIAEQGQLNARATDEQIKKAKEQSDALVKLRFNFEQNTFVIVEGLLPALQDIEAAFTSTSDSAEHMNEVGEVTGIVLKEITSVGLGVAEVFYQVGRGLAAIVAGVAAAPRGFKAMLEVMDDADDDLAAHAAATGERIQKIWEGAGDAARKAAAGGGGAEMMGPPDSAFAQARAQQLLFDKQHFEERINILKAFGQTYAEAIKTQSVLLDEAFKESGINNLRTQEQLIRDQAALQQSNLQAQRALQEQQRDLARGQGNLGKAAEAAGAIAQINAQIVANEAITQAKIRSLRSVTLQKQIDDYNNWRDGIEKIGLGVITTRRQAEDKDYADRLQALDVFIQANQDREAEGIEAKRRLTENHAHNMIAIAQDEWQSRVLFAQFTNRDLISINDNLFGVLATLMNSGSRRMFQIGKIASIANAVIKTYEAANNAFATGSAINPFAGYAFMAAAIAAGFVNVQKIQQAEFGGSHGGGGGTTFSPGVGTPGTPVVSLPQQAAPASQGGGVQVIVQGDFIGTREFMDTVVLPAIRQAADKDDRLLFGPGSQQNIRSQTATV